MPIGDDLTRWQYWWEWNKDPFLRLKEVVHATAVVRGSDDDLSSGARVVRARDTLRPTRAEIDKLVLPALKIALRRANQRDIVSSCLVAMAKIGRDHPDFAILPLLRQRLSSRDQEIRETAALAMGIAQMPAAIPDLIALVHDTEQGRLLCDRSEVDDRTRSFASYALGLIGAASDELGIKVRVFDSLAAVLRRESHSRNVRVASINAIGMLRPNRQAGGGALDLHDGIRKALWGYYERENRPSQQPVRAHVLPALARLLGGGGDRSGELKKALGSELRHANQRHAAIGQAAAVALGVLCEPRAVEPADGAYSDVLLRTFETALDHQTRFFCLMALGKIGGVSNQAALLRILDRGSKALVKPWAALALGVLAFEQRGADGFVQRGGLGATLGAALQRQLAGVKNPETQAAIAVGLGLCGYRDASDDLRKLLAGNQHRDELAGYLCIGLSLMGEDRAIDDIRRVVEASAPRPDLLRQASIALGKIGDRDASELLVEMMKGKDVNLAKLSSISVALGQIGDRRSIKPLVELLLDETEPGLSRAFAAVALGGVADKNTLPWNSTIAVDLNYRASVETLTNGISGVLDIL